MSTFGGKFKEIPGISVDRFDLKNLDSEAYFLSHCHTDHMVGLNCPIFQGLLIKRNCFLYVSHVSKTILKKLYPKIENQVKELDFHNPTTIYLKSGAISVIPIPSGHCPGSVMFLFESDRTILYTGDYRITSSDMKKIRAFYDSYEQLKNIHSIYLDTTFFFKSHLKFPSREESLLVMCDLIKEWLSIGENYIINIKTFARYGYEYAFMEIFKRIKMPVHVSIDAYEFYSLIPDMDKTVTLDGSKTRIHNSCGSSFRNICKTNDGLNFHTRTVSLSAMRWKNKDLQDGIISHNQYETHYVCYSTHASYEESVELIKFLKPKEVEPCVLRHEDVLNDEIYFTIEELLKSHDNKPAPKKLKLFNIEKIEAELQTHKTEENNVAQDIDDLFESALESPPRSRCCDIE